MTAALSGVDLAGCLLSVSVSKASPRAPLGRVGIRTRLGLMGILGAAERKGLRQDVFSELCMIACRKGRYADSVEELTPLGMDPLSVFPVVAIALRLILFPLTAERLTPRAIKNYGLSPRSFRRARELAKRD